MTIPSGYEQFLLYYICTLIGIASTTSTFRIKRRNHSTIKFYHVPYRIVCQPTNNYYQYNHVQCTFHLLNPYSSVYWIERIFINGTRIFYLYFFSILNTVVH